MAESLKLYLKELEKEISDLQYFRDKSLLILQEQEEAQARSYGGALGVLGRPVAAARPAAPEEKPAAPQHVADIVKALEEKHAQEMEDLDVRVKVLEEQHVHELVALSLRVKALEEKPVFDRADASDYENLYFRKALFQGRDSEPKPTGIRRL